MGVFDGITEDVPNSALPFARAPRVSMMGRYDNMPEEVPSPPAAATGPAHASTASSTPQVKGIFDAEYRCVPRRFERKPAGEVGGTQRRL